MDGTATTNSTEAPMIDPFGRHVSYLRVSVTDRCDFRCVYCMSEDMTFLPKKDVLSLEELERLCGAFIRKGVRKLRLTGGEPLVRAQYHVAHQQSGRTSENRRTRRADADHQRQPAGPLCRRVWYAAGVRRINVSRRHAEARKNSAEDRPAGASLAR